MRFAIGVSRFGAVVASVFLILGGAASAEPEAADFAARVAAERPAWLYADDPCPIDVAPDALAFTTDYAVHCQADPDRCLAGCRAGEANECYALARLVDAEDDIAAGVARRLFLQSCALGVSAGCTVSAARYAALSGDHACARRSFAATCAADDPWGCALQARMLQRGEGGPQDVDGARAAAERACALHPDFAACAAARRTLDAIERAIADDPE